MAKLGQNYGTIALGGFEHTLKNQQSSANKPLTLAEQLQQLENEAKQNAIDALTPKTEKNEPEKFGNPFVEIGQTNRDAMKASNAAKGKK